MLFKYYLNNSCCINLLPEIKYDREVYHFQTNNVMSHCVIVCLLITSDTNVQGLHCSWIKKNDFWIWLIKFKSILKYPTNLSEVCSPTNSVYVLTNLVKEHYGYNQIKNKRLQYYPFHGEVPNQIVTLIHSWEGY